MVTGELGGLGCRFRKGMHFGQREMTEGEAQIVAAAGQDLFNDRMSRCAERALIVTVFDERNRGILDRKSVV